VNEQKDAFLFSFYFNGHIKDGNDKNAVKNIIKRRLDCNVNKLDELFSGGEALFKENVDFASIVNLIKTFTEAGAGYEIKIADSIHSAVSTNEYIVDNAGKRSSKIDLEITISRSKMELDEIGKKFDYISELSKKFEDLSEEIKWKLGQKRINLNIKYNQIYEERERAVTELIKEEKDRVENRIKEMESFYRKVETNHDQSLVNSLLNEIKKWKDVSGLILSNAKKANVELGSNYSQNQCFIATAVFGEESFEVIFFRRWRDSVLKKNLAGKLFISLYYTFSPPIARLLRKHSGLNKIVKRTLIMLIGKILNREKNNG